MSSIKTQQRGLNELDLLTKSEAMEYVRVKTEALFDREFEPYVNIYTNGKCKIYVKKELLKVCLRKIQIGAQASI